MSQLDNELHDDLYLITKPVPEAGAQPFDCLNVKEGDPHRRYILQRFLDDHDVEAILARSAIQVVPRTTWVTIPSRLEIRRVWRRRVAHHRSPQGLRMV